MEELKYHTKAGQSYVQKYWKSDKSELIYCYKTRPSQEKLSAEEWCRERMRTEKGFDFRIISTSNFFFTCGWRLGSGEIRIETPAHSLIIKND